jgi:ParB/RepB/Spo0J family partition protein
MEIDIDLLEKAGMNAQYPSEMQSVTQPDSGFIVVLGRKVDKTSLQVEPIKTQLWSGNPRNFSSNVDVEDLLPQIKAAGTNTVPVYARYIQREGETIIEVIAGSRRRMATEKLSLPLTVDIIDINDDEAYFLAEMENNGRKDLDFIGSYRYLKFRFEALKASVGINVGKFAEKHALTRQHMSEIINIAELPDEILNSVQNPYSWTHRKLKALKQHFGQAKKQGIEQAFVDCCQSLHFESATALMTALAEIDPKQKPTVTEATVMVEGVDIKIKRNNSGSRNINVPAKLSEDKFRQIEQFILNMKD